MPMSNIETLTRPTEGPSYENTVAFLQAASVRSAETAFVAYPAGYRNQKSRDRAFTAIGLRFGLNLSYTQIAKRTGQHPASATHQINTGVKRLRESADPEIKELFPEETLDLDPRIKRGAKLGSKRPLTLRQLGFRDQKSLGVSLITLRQLCLSQSTTKYVRDFGLMRDYPGGMYEDRKSIYFPLSEKEEAKQYLEQQLKALGLKLRR